MHVAEIGRLWGSVCVFESRVKSREPRDRDGSQPGAAFEPAVLEGLGDVILAEPRVHLSCLRTKPNKRRSM